MVKNICLKIKNISEQIKNIRQIVSICLLKIPRSCNLSSPILIPLLGILIAKVHGRHYGALYCLPGS